MSEKGRQRLGKRGVGALGANLGLDTMARPVCVEVPEIMPDLLFCVRQNLGFKLADSIKLNH